jgi:hypothetical protein
MFCRKTGGHVLTAVFALKSEKLKMTSNEKMIDIKVVRLAETSNLLFELLRSKLVCNLWSQNTSET